ncbi:hypothetical protein CK203_084785 [Vitis vinifera]|uniref:Uncharacterized protein n=1 Tax=Vitis vinifera TaxID=29760 RepID=A0A438BVM2_VITVI|nr:hypothetical protein CK203_084785 [Vitis vinifera]
MIRHVICENLFGLTNGNYGVSSCKLYRAKKFPVILITLHGKWRSPLPVRNDVIRIRYGDEQYFGRSIETDFSVWSGRQNLLHSLDRGITAEVGEF